MPLASEVMDLAAALLNDAAKTKFTYAVMLPYTQSAWNKFQMHLQENGIPVMREISAVIDVAINATTINLPSGLIQPISLGERKDGTTDLFYPVDEKDIPEMDPIAEIRFWEWREENININPPTSAREVKLRYWKSLNPCSSQSSNLNALNSTEYLANKTASLTARYVGEDSVRADYLDAEAERYKDIALNLEVRAKQSQPVRPKGYSLR